MFCSNCGRDLNPAHSYCPQCGKQVVPQGTHSSLLKSKQPLFSVIGFIFLIGIIVTGWLLFRSDKIVEAVEGQMKAIASRQITEAYYGYTTKAFQTSTPLDVFRDFLQTNPSFSQNKGITFNELYKETGSGKLKGFITTKTNDILPVEWELVQEDHQWKINNILLTLQEPSIQKNEPTDSSKINQSKTELEQAQEILVNFMTALQSNNITQSYEITASEFQKTTSLEQFQNSLNQYPILTKFKNYEIQKSSIDKGFADFDLILDPGKGTYPFNIKLVKENDEWKVWSVHIQLQNKDKSSPTSAQTDNTLSTTVYDLLKALQQHEISQAYDKFFTKDFKAAIPLDKFESFVNYYPMLSDPQSKGEVNIMGEEKGKGQGTLGFRGVKEEIQFLLGFKMEDGVWKIQGLQVIQGSTPKDHIPPKVIEKTSESSLPSAISTEKGFDRDVLVKVIQEQLSFLQKREIEKAYQLTSAAEFKKATSSQSFQNFIELHPIFTNVKNADFPKLTFNNNIPTLSGILLSEDGRHYPTQYDFIKEEGHWKILHIEILPPLEEMSKKGPMEFTKIYVSNMVNDEGLVSRSQQVLKMDESIYVNIYVHNGVKNATITFNLEHLESQFKARTDSTTLPKEGDSVLSAVFEVPQYGWPTGKYQLRINSSTGLSQVYSFEEN